MNKILFDQIDKQIFSQVNFGQISAEQKKNMTDDVAEIIFDRALLRAIEEMPEEEKAQLLKELNAAGESDSSVEQLVQQYFPQMEKLVSEEVGSYKDEFMQLLSA